MDDRRYPLMLATGDVAAIVLFVLAGLANHRAGITGAGIARNAGPILAVWAAAALAIGAYRRPGLRTFLATWIVAVPIAIALRTLWLGHPTGEAFVTFLGVTLAMTLAFVGGWRLLAVGIRRRLGRPPPTAS